MSASGAWHQFHGPRAVLTAYELDDVPGILRAVDQHANDGKWCVGHVAYEAAAAFDPALGTRDPSPGLPLASFAVYDEAHPCDGPAARMSSLERRSSLGVGQLQLPLRNGYLQSLRRIQQEIANGNTYQVNHTERLSACLEGTAGDLFAELYRRQPTNLAAFIDLGRYAVASVSPELFFQRRGSIVTMRPMKGTVARGQTADQDKRNKHWLLASAKNRAENTMIVDLLRNDLGRLAQIGTVRVDELVQLETYPTFHALTSTISADVGDAGLLDVFAALFPCGSITGAPKASTMRIIADLETEPRGIYCGAIGVVAPGGDATFSVAIRTAVVDSDATVQYGVGSGITTDSEPDEEYAELVVKSRIMLDLQGPDLLETFRITEGVAVNIEPHLTRLQASACELGYDVDTPALVTAVDDLCLAHANGVWRARLLLGRDGQCRAEATPFDLDPGRSMTARICRDPVDSTDTRLRHKLSDRATYDRRRDPTVDTTLLINERGEITEFLFGNVVVRRSDRLLTPPLRCGLLPGVGRALAIESGVVHEQAIHVDELAGCTEIWHVNSLRGWTRVAFAADDNGAAHG